VISPEAAGLLLRMESSHQPSLHGVMPGEWPDAAKTKQWFPLLLALRGLRLAIAAVWRDPETKALPFVAGALLLTGTIFYWRAEDWTLIQALYFSVVTLTTVGYGDFTPTSAGTQIFTIIYIFIGLGVFVALLTSVAQQYIRQKSEGGGARERLRSRRRHDGPAEDAGPQ
jgi:voltage-gated potassium channel Kch